MTDQLAAESAQLALFAIANGNGHKTKAEVGLAKEIPAGAERLLGELLKRGLEQDAIGDAAALVPALEEGAKL